MLIITTHKCYMPSCMFLLFLSRYSARILQRMRAIMEREKKTASAAAAAANGGPNSSTTADTHHVNSEWKLSSPVCRLITETACEICTWQHFYMIMTSNFRVVFFRMLNFFQGFFCILRHFTFLELICRFFSRLCLRSAAFTCVCVCVCLCLGGYYDLHMENLKLFTNETTQTYVRLEQQVTASLNDVILSAENQKQVSIHVKNYLSTE